jgi:hypothetical protein
MGRRLTAPVEFYATNQRKNGGYRVAEQHQQDRGCQEVDVPALWSKTWVMRVRVRADDTREGTDRRRYQPHDDAIE